VFAAYPDQIAAVIIEPIAGNMGCIPPIVGFLEGLRSLTQQHGTVLIFDEVMTGFRVARGGAQALYGITPDLTTLGKIIGGGLPVGAFGGRADIMSHIAPEGNVYQAGTLSGNPLATVAGLTVLKALNADVYQTLQARTSQLASGLRTLAAEADIPVCVNKVCGMFGLFFTAGPVTEFDHAANANIDQFNRFFHAMLDEGIYLAPSAFEAGFISTAHTSDIIDATLAAAARAFNTLKAG
jgi:glutamate-1-semialdehyde 2,1-aminomutase